MNHLTMVTEIEFLRQKMAEQAMMFTAKQKSLLLVLEAFRWVGVQEIGGNNSGQIVEMFQADAGIHKGDAWCMAFVQNCISSVDRTCSILGHNATALMPSGAHCMTVWEKTQDILKSQTPKTGSVVIWHRKETSSGHTGIVVDTTENGLFQTIEGNTSPSEGVQRDGDGVFKKTHNMTPTGTMELVGFINPWG